MSWEKPKQQQQQPQISIWRRIGSNPVLMSVLFLLGFLVMVTTGHYINGWNTECPGTAKWVEDTWQCMRYREGEIPIIIRMFIDAVVGFIFWGPIIWVLWLGAEMALDLADPQRAARKAAEEQAAWEAEYGEDEETEDDTDNR